MWQQSSKLRRQQQPAMKGQHGGLTNCCHLLQAYAGYLKHSAGGTPRLLTSMVSSLASLQVVRPCHPAQVCRASYSLECVGFTEPSGSTRIFKSGVKGGWGRPDVFEIGPMAWGFDELAWAVKGLPSSGQLVFRLTVASVGL